MRSPHEHLSRTLLLTLVLSSAAGLLITPLILSRRPATPPAGVAAAPPESQGAQALETFGRVPLSFEANQGQAESSVDFVARGAGYAFFVKPTEAVFALRNSDCGSRIEDGADHPLTTDAPHTKASPKSATCNTQSKVLRMKLVGADASVPAVGAEELAGKANYFVGDDPARWQTNVPTFARVRYAGVYEGVDLVYYGNQRQLEYDFSVAPGADPRAVALRFEGADKVELDASGDLLLRLGGSVVRQPKPVIYQEAAGVRREVEGGYVVEEGGRVGFKVGEYDRSAPLVIDPTIVYSTYLGGSAADQAWAVAVDPSGSVYVAGFTVSTNFPTANAIQAANGGFQDAFVAKLNPAGNALVYSTYIGGSGGDQARGLAVDSSGAAYITGFTGSTTNFPTVNPVQAAFGGNGQDAFVTKLNPAGNALVYSSYIGGNGGNEFGEGIAVDSGGNAYLTGDTDSTNFPTANALQAAFAGSTDVFLTRLNATGNAFVYSTYLGGAGFEIAKSVAVDSLGAAYVTGDTDSTNFPTLNPIQAANAGGAKDAFVTKVSAAGTGLVYSTYLGGSAQDNGEGIAVDSTGNAYVTGTTFSTNFPTANAIQPANGTSGGSSTQDAFVTKLNIAGNALVYSTYLGGAGGEVGSDIKVDSAGAVYVVGGTGSTTTFPTANAIQCARSGGSDAFVTKLNTAGNAFVYSTYLGGSGSGAAEQARGVAVDSSGNAYVVGNTTSNDFPTVTPIQAAFGGDAAIGDAFVFKLADATTGAASLLQFTQTNVSVQEDVTSLTLTVQRTGDTSGAVTVDYATSDGTASERSDYTTAVGTLRFAAGDTSKTIDILVNEDSYTEGTENFTVALSNPTGGAAVSCLTAVATVQITDDASEPSSNAIDDATVFVGQHYHDFLNRQADTAGLNFWAGQITACGGDAACVDRARKNVSQAFFLSIEFQNTGYFVFRTYKASFTDSTERPRGMPRYREFLRDSQEIGRGIIVGQGNWKQQLDDNKLDFARRWVQRADFIAEFPLSMTADQYINKLYANLNTTPTQAEFNASFESYSNTVEGRARTLRTVVDVNSVYNRQFNPAFVLAQYIGYLRRNPNDAPEPGLNYAGFDFWLAKLDSFSQPGEDVFNEGTAIARANRAEMVRAFILSTEYRQRFGQP
ncbi:MAG TPA: SBBP repeat-containing protein [Pyrinomonadaceae bacterium]|nr:SBBP repeat-containing protein [Pyrinomonadaceae bacterium]